MGGLAGDRKRWGLGILHRFRSIAARLLWSYLIAAALPLVLVGSLLLNIGLTTQRENVYLAQRNLAGRAARDAAVYFNSLLKEFDSYEVFVQPSNPQIEQWREAARKLAERTYPNLVTFALLDVAGQEQLRVENLQLVPDQQLRDERRAPDVQQAIAQNQPQILVIPGDRDLNNLLLTVPLHTDSGTIIGTLRATIDAEPLVNVLRTTTSDTNSYAYFIRASSGEVLFDDGRPNFSPPLDHLAVTGQLNTAREYIGARNLQVVGVTTAVQIGQNTQSDWLVVVEQPSAVAFADLSRSIWVLMLIMVLVVSAVLIWALRQARAFITPLTALQRGATIIGGGHLDHRITIMSDDEFGDVAKAFNQMSAHLQQSLDQIERQNERLRHGLALARDIQLGLLPDRAPWGNDEIAVFARSVPAYEVGGDFYTYIALSEGRAAISIGDISGKGVGAALLMSLTSSAVESHGRELEHPAEVLASLNNLLAPRLKANHMNAALMFVVIDPHQRQLRVANAGMISPVLISGESSQFLDVGGLPIGSFSGAVYHDLTVEIQPGDMLLLLSDGVVEAHNERGEMYGFERLEALVTEASVLGDVRAMVELVLSRVQEFIGDAEQHDDITLVAIRPTLAVEGSLLGEQASVYATV